MPSRLGLIGSAGALIVAALISHAAGLWSFEPATSSTITEPVEPLTVIARSKTGGVVAEVRGYPGERVSNGQTLVRLEDATLLDQKRELQSALQAIRATVESSKVAGAIPAAARPIIVDAHPEVVASEERYVGAITAFEHGSAEERVRLRADLDRATAARIEVRQRIAGMLAKSVASADLASMVSTLETRLRELDQALAESEVRAPADSVIEILGLHPGDWIPPGSPVAVLTIPGEYFCEFPISAEDAAHLRVGLKSKGTLLGSHQRINWQVESLVKQSVPAAFRQDRRISEETVVRGRFSSPVPLQAGATVSLELPRWQGQ